MKKYLSLLVMMMMVIFPLTAKADAELHDKFSCTSNNGSRTCTVVAETDEDSLTVTLTEKGGANITNVEGADWTLSNVPADNGSGVWTVEVSGLATGEVSLFRFTYDVSGQEGCKILVGLGDKVITDDPTPPPKTGSSLPYVALGMIALLAGGAYVATKDKAKMYRL